MIPPVLLQISKLKKTVTEPWSLKPEEWERLNQTCLSTQIETLLYFRLRETPEHDCPSEIFSRLQNRFESAFAHAAVLKREVQEVLEASREAGIRMGFIKGFPLACRYYPHIATRVMQDIDFCCDESRLEDLGGLFKKLGYSIMPDQSRLERKTGFIKLIGQKVIAFEWHRSVYTSYRKKAKPVSFSDFDEEGMPSPELLLLSILLHHRFYEGSIRDFLDIEMVLSRKAVDWNTVTSYCREEKLSYHASMIQELCRDLFHSPWSDKAALISVKAGPLRKAFWGVKMRGVMLSLKKRGILEQFYDAMMMLFVYDSLLDSVEPFLNKYFRFVKPHKYQLLLRKLLLRL